MADQRICSVEGCGKAVDARGFCSSHYARLRRHGDPIAGRTPDGHSLDFLQNVVLSHDGNDCLFWPFGRRHSGYPTLRHNGHNVLVSRLVCEYIHGPPPTDKHEAAHKCGKGHLGCISPACLYWATHKENHADRLVHGTLTRGEANGQSKLTEENVREIRRLKGDVTREQLALRFGVTCGTVKVVQSNKSWSWLK